MTESDVEKERKREAVQEDQGHVDTRQHCTHHPKHHQTETETETYSGVKKERREAVEEDKGHADTQKQDRDSDRQSVRCKQREKVQVEEETLQTTRTYNWFQRETD